jgi:16S rRNA (cytosine967-C5)-methyltransferase
VTELVYGGLRREITLDACLKPRLKDPGKLPPEVLDALRLGSYEKLFRGTAAHAAVSEWVDIVKNAFPKLAGLANAVLRRVELPQTLDAATRYGLPAWLYEEWRQLFGEETARKIAEEMLEPAPLWLMSYHPKARESLEAQGCEVILGPLEDTLEVRSPLPLAELEAFEKGWVQPQNPASTLPARLLGAEPGERVLDSAGGSGVKAAQLAAMGARVTSIDLHEGKARRGRRNLRRLGLEADFLSYDLRTVPEIEPAPKVLLDAPCAGTGTLRGHPELRTRLTPHAVSELAALQRELLATAAALTAPDGALVYALCTLTQEESVENVRWFLESRPDFEPVAFTSLLPSLEIAEGRFILPYGGLDGFFIGVFRRGS